MVTLKASALEEFVRDIFVKSGCSAAEGARVGKYLVQANLTGHDSHGVVRVPRYVQMKNDGLIVADQKIEVAVDTPVLAVVDAHYAFGQTAAPQAVQIGIDKCKAMGLSAVALRNSGHIGRVGDWAEMAAASGLVSVHFVNAAGSILVAPFNATERRFSTAPYCVGVPRPGQMPLILDFATSVVAEGKVLVASKGGKKVPDHALIGPDGKMTSDPHVLYGEYDSSPGRDYRQGKGAIRAFGDHKGSGLAFMCEVLGGALTGTGAATPGRRFANGMLSFYIDPKIVDPSNFLSPDLTRFVDWVKTAKPVPGEEVLVPGETEARMRADRLANGVPLPDEIWQSLVTTARQLGLDERRIQAAGI